MDAALGMIYPNWCQLCNGGPAFAQQGFVCERCKAAAKLIEPPWCKICGRPYEGAITDEFTCSQCVEVQPVYSSARSAAFAKGPVLDAVHLYKYHHGLFVEPFLAHLLIEAARDVLDPAEWDYIVPIPLHATKQREREFNQAERVGRRLGEAVGVPLECGFVKRVAHTPSQTLLSREERFKNVRKAFRAVQTPGLKGARLIIVDDVFTTGATANGCAKALLEAGAARVCVWTVARGV